MKKSFSNVEEVFNKFPELYGGDSEYQRNRYRNLFDKFCSYYNVNDCFIASSSGRVEILGNHTDHNGGRVISSTISLDTLAFFLPTNDNKITLYSEGYGEILVDLSDLSKQKESTSKGLVAGVADYFIKNGKKIGGFKAYCSSNVLGGGGISSSASFEVLIAEILNFLYNENTISCEEKALASWYAENVYFNKPCGKLDQTAISFGGINLLDFSDENKINVFPINNTLKDYDLVLINTGGSHENLTDEYASIPREMKRVANLFGKDRLIEINKKDFFSNLDKVYNKCSDREISRAIHFYQENDRVDLAYNSLINEDYQTFLRCVNDSGVSSNTKLQNCMVIGSSDQPIIKTLSILSCIKSCSAFRIHGGGFAGCVLAIVKKSNFDDFNAIVSRIFNSESVIKLNVRSVGAITL